jgi:2-acylglycerol O-acyltransferase 2
MQPGGGEVAYLRRRLGFVRVALQHGAPLVPVFAFGQSRVYGYVRPFIDFPRRAKPSAAWARLVRWIGFVPLVAWGPRRVGVYIAVGRPLAVPRVAEPTDALVEEHLGRFIAELEALFERHKREAGYQAESLAIH